MEAGNVILRGVDPEALPEGNYYAPVQVEEADTRQATTRVDVKQDGHGILQVEVRQDDRTVDVDVSSCDPGIDHVLDASQIDGVPAPAWLEADDWRPTRKACLLNLLAALRVSPSKSDHLNDQVHEVFKVSNDRAYIKVVSALAARIDNLVKDRTSRSTPKARPAAIHRLLLDEIPRRKAWIRGAAQLSR